MLDRLKVEEFHNGLLMIASYLLHQDKMKLMDALTDAWEILELVPDDFSAISGGIKVTKDYVKQVLTEMSNA